MLTNPGECQSEIHLKVVTVNGVERTVAEHCAVYGITLRAVYDRRRKGSSWNESFRPLHGGGKSGFVRPAGKLPPHNARPKETPPVAAKDSVKRTRFL